MPVEVSKAVTGTISDILTYAGTLQPKDSVKLSPLVNGQVVTVTVKVGDSLKAGDPVVQLDQTTVQAQVDQAQANLTANQQKLTRMQIGLARPRRLPRLKLPCELRRLPSTRWIPPRMISARSQPPTWPKPKPALQLAQHDYDKISYSSSASSSAQALALQQATINYQQAVASYNLTINPTDGQLAPLQNNLAQAQLKLALTKQPYIDSDLAQVQATVDQAKAALNLAKAQLSYATVRAPFDGIVAEVYVSPGAFVSTATPVIDFISSAQEVALDVEEARIGQIKNDQHASLRVATYPGKDFGAMVTSVAPMADSKTHSFQIKVTPADPTRMLRAGMYADVQILANQKQNTVLIPAVAITPVNNQSVVYVVKADNTVEARTVTTGLANNDQVEILSGVQAGEAVVTAGQSNLANGARVQVTRGG